MALFRTQTTDLTLPSRSELIGAIEALASESDAAARCLAAVRTGEFVHPDGRRDTLGDVLLAPEQLGLLAYLGKSCRARLSIDIGFGMGTSATAILAARSSVGDDFRHFVYDPYGLGRGEIVEEYIRAEFGAQYRRVYKRSHVGLAQMYDERGGGVAGLIFIDGSHTFEDVMADFVLSDLLCSVGGYIVFDDALYPAIESVVNYITANRPGYSVAHLTVPNTTVLKKVEKLPLAWNAFKPFAVPQREDWDALVADAAA